MSLRCAFSFVRTAVVAVPLLLLASNGAQAQMPSDPRNQCGALAGTPPAADCSNQAYANGILYDGVGGGGVASDVTLTIRGGAATTITAPSSPVTAWKDDAIIVVTNTGTSRDIVLNVAAGDDDGNAVVIVGGGGARLAQASSSITMAMPTTTRR